MKILWMIMFFVSSLSLAAMSAPGEGPKHGRGATLCDYNCEKHATPVTLGEETKDRKYYEDRVYCSLNPEKCTEAQKKRIGYGNK